MKRILVFLFVLLFSCSAFAESALTGGWTASDVTPLPMPAEAEEALNNAQTGLDAKYEPVALLATQVVADTNYCFLCKATAGTLNADKDEDELWQLVYVYRDLQGKASIIDTDGIDLEIDGPDYDDDDDDDDAPLAGGWQVYVNESVSISEDAAAAFDKALDSLGDALYMPVAELGSQVVAGRNYCLLCAVTPYTLDKPTTYALVYVYVNPQGAATVADIDDVEIEID